MDDPALLSLLRVRQAVGSDLPALEWGGEYVHFRQLYADVYHNALAGKAIMWVVDLPEGEIIGQAFVSLESGRHELADGKNRAYIYGFRVKSAYRRRGVGAFLLKTIEADLIQKGFGIVTLNVGRENIDALRLYKRLGYQVVAEEAGKWWYFDHLGRRRDVHEPAWRMEKLLKSD